MKIAIFSDVQGNLPAMRTTLAHIDAWQPDHVIMNGDLINRGPSSAACLDLFEQRRRDQGWLPVRGNHEDFILHCSRHAATSELDRDMRQFADWTHRQLAERTEWLRDWPDHLCLQGPNDEWVHATHGSLAGNRDGISKRLSDQQLTQRVPLDVSVFVVAHTHKPLQRTLGTTRILNVGSVGSPFDGDIRASYGRIEHRGGRWHSEIVRLDYDRAQAQRDFKETGFLDQGGPLAGILFEEWRRAELLMPSFRSLHLPALEAHELSLEAAVKQFLDAL